VITPRSQPEDASLQESNFPFKDHSMSFTNLGNDGCFSQTAYTVHLVGVCPSSKLNQCHSRVAHHSALHESNLTPDIDHLKEVED
jgi:hypothetical protein